MKVFKMKLVMGKETQYDAQGKLKNKIITPDYHGEKEIFDLLDDQNWRKLGACEISCISVFDTKEPNKIDTNRVDEINKQIQDELKGLNKPKTETQLLKEQNDLLIARLEALENGKLKAEGNPSMLNNVIDQMHSDYNKAASNKINNVIDRKTLENKANELNIQFRANIGDEKLLEKINEIDTEFKL